jgi:hypothetical protein
MDLFPGDSRTRPCQGFLVIPRMKCAVNSNPPSPPDPASSGLPSAPHLGGAAYGAPVGGAPAPAAPAKRSRRKGLFAAGCGCLALFVLVIGGCSALVMGGDEAPEAAETTSAPTEAPVEEAPVEEAPAEEAPAEEEAPADGDVPGEFTSALNSAQSYSDLMHMSYQGLFDQLTSEYGDQFSEEAAQYAVDNVDADWNENALKSAESYSETLHMSKQGIYDQLISEHGEQFTEEQAQYAIDTIDVDWKQNALESARSYRDTMDMSPEAIRDQLTSEYGEKFTQEEADYAIENLDG